MMAGAQAACIAPNITGWVALREQVTARLRGTAVRRKPNFFTGLEIVNDAARRPKRLCRLGTDAVHARFYVQKSIGHVEKQRGGIDVGCMATHQACSAASVGQRPMDAAVLDL